jgi:magnesium-transporting ATPase (P-type)
VFLWMMDSNQMLSFFILVMLLGSSFMISVQRIRALVGYRSMTLQPHQVYVLNKGQWIAKSSYDILPGDLVAVQPGYQHKKS